MANLQKFSYAPGTAGLNNVPTYSIVGQVTDSSGTVLADYTGANALSFPSCLSALSAAQLKVIMDQIAPMIALMRSGQWQQ